ncbi:hypothetical protein OKE63_03840 [Riemerella anatipestifer]|uniref:hypothetical protein n=1 Tax=Riemerella anatipestifer TaxID=34085 RepID=UPI0021F8BFF5|nr:hypothetical protein [Riemerella anatipestifer]MCW0498295.1 hypothetical protein [Riemerella anatipestifer]
MRKLNILLGLLISSLAFSQLGNVGINTLRPEARLEVKSLGNTFGTKALRLTYGANASNVAFSISDNGIFGFNNISPKGAVDIITTSFGAFDKGWTSEADKVADSEAATNNTGYTYTPKLQTFYSYGAGSFDNNNLGGILFVLNLGSSAIFNVNVPKLGNYILPVSAAKNPKSGVFFSASGLVGGSFSQPFTYH